VANGWCRFCGYYGILGRCVDVADWEQEFVNGEYVSEEEAADEHPWLVAIKAVPPWAWIQLGVLAVIALLMVLVHLCTVTGSAYHILAAVGLLACGLFTTLGTHIYAGIRNMREDPDFSPLDVAIHPIRMWFSVFVQLPETTRPVTFLWAGLWTLILVHTVVGVPYVQMIDLSAPAKRPQLGVTPGDIASAAASASTGKAMTLDEALGELTDQAGGVLPEDETEAPTLKEALGQVFDDLRNGIENGGPPQSEEEAKPEFVKKELKAVIIGYTTAVDSDDIQSIVLAVRSNGKWRVAGTISSGFTAEVLDELNSQLDSIRREQPFVASELSAKWVEPILRCRIEAEYSETADKFGTLAFLELL
jgi:hypothetical protein